MNPPTRHSMGMSRITCGEGSPAIRSYPDVAAELSRRHGIVITATRVQQICARAERKMRELLAAELGGVR